MSFSSQDRSFNNDLGLPFREALQRTLDSTNQKIQLRDTYKPLISTLDTIGLRLQNHLKIIDISSADEEELGFIIAPKHDVDGTNTLNIAIKAGEIILVNNAMKVKSRNQETGELEEIVSRVSNKTIPTALENIKDFLLLGLERGCEPVILTIINEAQKKIKQETLKPNDLGI